MDEDYLKRGLSRRVDSAFEGFVKDIEKMMAVMASKGMLNSGNTLIQFEQIGLASYSAWFSDVAQFLFTVSGGNESPVRILLQYASDVLIDRIRNYLLERQKNTGAPEAVGLRQVDSIHIELLNRQIALIDDFEHGMAGSDKLKKDPLVSVVAHQTNSPGAVQQVGAGTFSQTAYVQNCGPLGRTAVPHQGSSAHLR